MATGPKPMLTPKRPRKSKPADVRLAAEVLFVHSHTFRDLLRLIRKSRGLAALADRLAARLPHLAEVGAFGFSVNPDLTAKGMVDDLRALTWTCNLVAGVIESDLPAGSSGKRK